MSSVQRNSLPGSPWYKGYPLSTHHFLLLFRVYIILYTLIHYLLLHTLIYIHLFFIYYILLMSIFFTYLLISELFIKMEGHTFSFKVSFNFNLYVHLDSPFSNILIELRILLIPLMK